MTPTGCPPEPDSTSVIAQEFGDAPAGRQEPLDSDAGAPESFRPTVSVIPPPPVPSEQPPRATAWLRPRLALAVLVMLACGVLAGGAPMARSFASHLVGHFASLRARIVPRFFEAPSAAPAQLGGVPVPRADARLARGGRTPVSPGVLAIPPSFSSSDGAYDLCIHFHGNTELVIDNFGAAGVNAAVLVINLGINSGVYEDRYGNPDELKDLLSRTQRAMEKRGLENAHLRRLALTSWSAGYGAILRSIENPTLFEMVDTIVLLDGMHARLLGDGEQKLDTLRIEPFVKFARAAVAGNKLFVITHSDVQPPDYPGVRETTDAVLGALGIARKPGGTSPEMPVLSSTHGVPKSKIIPLEPRTQVDAGGLHVRGFHGVTAEHHMAHLIRMATVGLPELSRRYPSR